VRTANIFVPIAASLALAITGGTAFAAGAAAEAAAVVTTFNAAISSRNLDQATGLFAPGGVQFSLRPAHTGLGGQQPNLTADLRAHWSMIAPVVFTATKGYSRKAAIIDARADGDLATVWTTITTETVHADKSTTRDKFVELYLLVRKDGAWKIGAIADNRNPNDTGLGGGKP
jgi:hypothetical protein